MPTDYRPGRGVLLWRGLIIFLMLVVALVIVAIVALFNTNHESIARGKKAIANNRELGCQIGGFLVDVPIIKQPGITEAQFQGQVDKALDFLASLRRLDCDGLGKVTTAKIDKQTKALRKIEGGGGSTGNPHSPGSLPGGGTPPAPSSPPPPPPPPSSTTTTPPPPPPGGGNGGGVLRRICHQTPLGRMICELIPGVVAYGF